MPSKRARTKRAVYLLRSRKFWPQKWKCLYVGCLMAGYWMTRALPLAVTSLVPVALFPLLGILGTKRTCEEYFTDSSAMFLSALFISFALEASNVHRRIALAIVDCVGTTPRRLLLGLMVSTTFTSMWIVNAAATALMAPNALQVLRELEAVHIMKAFEQPRGDEPPLPTSVTRCYLLGIAYAASIGGIGTLVGSATNMAFKGTFELKFPHGPRVEFARWIVAMLPMVVIMILGVWLLLCSQYFGLWRKEESEDYGEKLKKRDLRWKTKRVIEETIRDRRNELGPMKWTEIIVAILFSVAVFLWSTRNTKWAPRWAQDVGRMQKGDATVSILICILLFIIPSSTSIFYCAARDPDKRPHKRIPAILTWGYVKVKMIWGVILLIGGGFALVKGFEETGATAMLRQATRGLKALPPYVVMLLCCFVVTNLTELAANVAVAQISLPVVSEIAVACEINPLYLMIPVTLCCSFSFMTPVGSPTNALVSRLGNIRTKDMMISGITPSILTYLVVILIFPTWGALMYDLGYQNWQTSRETFP